MNEIPFLKINDIDKEGQEIDPRKGHLGKALLSFTGKVIDHLNWEDLSDVWKKFKRGGLYYLQCMLEPIFQTVTVENRPLKLNVTEIPIQTSNEQYLTYYNLTNSTERRPERPTMQGFVFPEGSNLMRYQKYGNGIGYSINRHELRDKILAIIPPSVIGKDNANSALGSHQVDENGIIHEIVPSRNEPKEEWFKNGGILIKPDGSFEMLSYEKYSGILSGEIPVLENTRLDRFTFTFNSTNWLEVATQNEFNQELHQFLLFGKLYFSNNTERIFCINTSRSVTLDAAARMCHSISKHLGAESFEVGCTELTGGIPHFNKNIFSEDILNDKNYYHYYNLPRSLSSATVLDRYDTWGIYLPR